MTVPARPGRGARAVAVVLLGLAAAALVLASCTRSTPRQPARPAAGKLQTFRAAGVRGGVATFKLRLLRDFTIRHGEVRVGALRQRVAPAKLRSGARRHRISIRLSSRLRTAQHRAAARRRVPVLAVSTAGPLVPVRGALLGAAHDSGRAWSARGMRGFERAIGRRLAIDHHFHAWGTDYWPSPRIEGVDVANGRIPMLSLGGREEFPGLDAVLNGSQDRFLRAAARRVKRFGTQLFLRPLWEMNGDWMPWSGAQNNSRGKVDGPAKYVAAWRRMHDIFLRAGATNAVWVWSPNCADHPRAGWNHWSRYYPGDAYVDWVACDGYNRGTLKHWSRWESFASIFDGDPSVYRDYSRKPFMVAETGSCDRGGAKAGWISAARRTIESRMRNVKALVWFDIPKECDWRVSSSPSSLAAFRALATDPYFRP